ncbi:MAG: 1-aminocyclopropane-1-carboxylate deaminase/D-cysteine desulfhydrase [bacterium]
MNDLLLFQKFPALRKLAPWISLGEFPTPVQRLSNLGQQLGKENLWIKRDDLSGELYGGNKVRTLEFSLAEAQQKKAELIVTYSAIGSNWPLACVVYARSLQIPTDVIFMPFPMDTIKKKNLQAIERLANRVLTAKSLLSFPFLYYFHLRKERKKQRVYQMPPAGVSPLTILGWVNAVLELQQQVASGCLPRPDGLFCPLGSGGTAAGLSLGLNLIGWPTKVFAVRVVDRIVANRFNVNRLLKKSVRLLQKAHPEKDLNKNWGENIHILHKFAGKGYSQPTPQAEKSIELLQAQEGLTLDSTYTGKTFAALLALCQQAHFKHQNILFWHTLNSRSLDELSVHFNR